MTRLILIVKGLTLLALFHGKRHALITIADNLLFGFFTPILIAS